MVWFQGSVLDLLVSVIPVLKIPDKGVLSPSLVFSKNQILFKSGGYWRLHWEIKCCIYQEVSYMAAFLKHPLVWPSGALWLVASLQGQRGDLVLVVCGTLPCCGGLCVHKFQWSSNGKSRFISVGCISGFKSVCGCYNSWSRVLLQILPNLSMAVSWSVPSSDTPRCWPRWCHTAEMRVARSVEHRSDTGQAYRGGSMLHPMHCYSQWLSGWEATRRLVPSCGHHTSPQKGFGHRGATADTTGCIFLLINSFILVFSYSMQHHSPAHCFCEGPQCPASTVAAKPAP